MVNSDSLPAISLSKASWELLSTQFGLSVLTPQLMLNLLSIPIPCPTTLTPELPSLSALILSTVSEINPTVVLAGLSVPLLPSTIAVASLARSPPMVTSLRLILLAVVMASVASHSTVMVDKSVLLGLGLPKLVSSVEECKKLPEPTSATITPCLNVIITNLSLPSQNVTMSLKLPPPALPRLTVSALTVK